VLANPELVRRYRAMLDGPECADELRYLIDWCYQLHGRSGAGMGGVSPLSWATLRDWREMNGLDDLLPQEVDVLFALDGVLCAYRPPDVKTDHR